jgi:hypothetical protein
VVVEGTRRPAVTQPRRAFKPDLLPVRNRDRRRGYLVIGTRFGLLIVDVQGEEYGAKQSIQTGSSSQSVTVTADGGFAIVLTSTGELLLIDIKGDDFGSAKSSIQTGSSSQSVTLSADGSTLYVSTSDGRILVYSFTLLGSAGGAAVEGSLGGFAFVPVDTVFVGRTWRNGPRADTLWWSIRGQGAPLLAEARPRSAATKHLHHTLGALRGRDNDVGFRSRGHPRGADGPGPPNHLGSKLYQRTERPVTAKMIKNGSGERPRITPGSRPRPGTISSEMTARRLRIRKSTDARGDPRECPGRRADRDAPVYHLFQSTNPFRGNTGAHPIQPGRGGARGWRCSMCAGPAHFAEGARGREPRSVLGWNFGSGGSCRGRRLLLSA